MFPRRWMTSVSAAGGAPNGSAAAPPRDAKRARPADARLPRYHGTAFVQATGTVERKALKSGETLVVDSYSLVAWHDASNMALVLQ